MKISDFVFDYQGNIKYEERGFCRVRIFTSNGRTLVILTELDNNDGQSVTNCIEDIIESLYKQGFIIDKEAIFVEHYEYYRGCGYTPFSFEIFKFDKEEGNFWRKISLQKLLEVIDDGFRYKDELVQNSLGNKSFFEKTQEIIVRHQNYFDKKYHKDPEYTRRFLDIERNKKTKQDLKQLIDNNAKEREDLLPFLHSDLSLLGETYSHMTDEYIVIPEFPLGGGYIDFVVFSGRSRMDVIFIEVKGADFNLMNLTGYKDFNSNIHKAAKQLRDRIDFSVYNQYDEFRKKCHEIRESIECNNYHSKHLLSPFGRLLVDPNKDICLRTVIIGGRSQNDYEESRERHKYERDHAIPIELDSWDSWINKLKRD